MKPYVENQHLAFAGPGQEQPTRESDVARKFQGTIAVPVGKRLLDTGLAAVGLALSAPLWGLMALAIKLEDGGPVFYSQWRVGQAGRLFRTVKFRTMIPDAEETGGPVLASPDDPRVTRAGKILRATAMDELPQLLNILFGRMSFVGPRPERPQFVEQFRGETPGYEGRFQVPPGLTGLAQIYGHYNSSPRQKLRYELLYLRRRSLWLDLKLIAASFWVSFRGRWQHRGRKL